MEFSKAIEDFNKDLIDDEKQNDSDNENDDLIFHTRSDLITERRCFRNNMNSVIEKEDLLLDSHTYRERGYSNYSIGDEILTNNERSEVSETTKNINGSFDDDQSNRREEIEASIESLELKAICLLNNDENILKLCQDKMKDFFEKCMKDESTSDEDLKKYIQSVIKSKESQSPAVGDLISFEKVNEIITILSKIQYQLHKL